MKKTFILMVLIVFIAPVSSHEGFAENSCGGQAVVSGIVRTLGWKLSDELLTRGIVWLTSSSAETRCPSIGGSLLSLVCKGAFFLPQAVRTCGVCRGLRANLK